MRHSGSGPKGPRRGVIRAFVLLGAAVVLAVSAALASMVVVLHLGVRPVLTGSMRPTYGPGSILVTQLVPVNDLHPGMIALFVPPGEHVEFAHRITSVSGPASDPTITTKGDANKTSDPWHARLTTGSVPVVVATVPWVGRLMVGIHGPVQLVLIILGGLVVAVAGTKWILRPRRPALTMSA
jgi:signal peptidase I